MAAITGGVSDKLGNEYEGLWAVRNLLELISGAVSSMVIEPLGEDGRGVEFWVRRPDDTREGHQCKRENASRGDWTAAVLEEKGVLADAKFQIDRDPSHHFYFVSGDKVTLLGDLAERACRGDTSAAFVKYATTTSGKLNQEFENLCRYLVLNPVDPTQLAQIRDFLCRFHVLVKDKNSLRREVEDFSARWVSGSPQAVVTQLESFASRNEVFGKTITEADVVRALPADCSPRDLGKDGTLRTKIDKINERFRNSYRHLLVAGSPLGRTESKDLLNLLDASAQDRLILMHGAGGVGKSGVIFEVEAELAQKGIAHLALRLDRDKPGDSPVRFTSTVDLPASPAACLATVASTANAVLILDQLDAIRWTAAHSAYAWESCESLIAEALRYPNLRVVVVCRSFDVEDDPRIREWHAREKAVKFLVSPLDDAFVNAVVERAGIATASLDTQQRNILRSPQSLYLWSRLRRETPDVPAFRTTTDLMKSFWRMVREQLKGLRDGEYTYVIDELVTYMDDRGQLDAPRSIIAAYPSETAALISLSILTEAGTARLLFAHQSYLDHLTAERVLRQIHKQSLTVVNWLRKDDQSLFRRSQLRQLLTLLRDEDPALHAETLLDLITADGIRFHLRHLALQALGHADKPTEREADLAIRLFDDERWRDHVWGQVFFGRSSWFEKLYEKGVLWKWLSDGDGSRTGWVMTLAGRVVNQCPNLIEDLFMGKEPNAAPKALEAIVQFGDPLKFSTRLFNGYCQLLRNGSAVGTYLDWKAIAENDGERALLLLQARLHNVLRHTDIPENAVAKAHGDSDHLIGKARLAFDQAVRRAPEQTWIAFMPLLDAAATRLRELHRESATKGFSHSRYDRRMRLLMYRGALLQLLITAGRTLAELLPERFIPLALGRGDQGSKVIDRVIALSLTAGPVGWADKAINWVLKRPVRIRCGNPYRSRGYAGAYRPARAILKKFARHCSTDLFAILESSILAYRPASELRDFRAKHDWFMGRSFFGDGAVGRIYERDLFIGQYLLLSALPDCRLSPSVRDWRGVLKRKFGNPQSLMKRRQGGVGGFVGSTIPSDRIHLISDRQWSRIIKSNWSPKAHRYKQMGNGRLGEVRHELFAGDFGAMTRRQPTRFARLALRLPVSIDAHYLHSLLHAFAETSPPANGPDGKNWKSAGITEVEAVLARFAPRLTERDVASAFCWLVMKRPGETWADITLQRIAELATGHPHPQSGEYTVFSGTHGKDDKNAVDGADVVRTALNCVRGQAAGAIQNILFERPETYPLFSQAIETLVVDTHPSVRIASIGIAIPLLNRDRIHAVDVFLRACDIADDEVLRSHHLGIFLSYTLLGHLKLLEPLLTRMIASKIDEVEEAGAQWIAGIWALKGLVPELFDECRNGSVNRRKGVANMLAREVARGDVRPEARSAIVGFFNDTDTDVRNEAAAVFRHPDFFRRAQALELAEAFVTSKAIENNADDFLIGLKQADVPLHLYASVLSTVTACMAGLVTAETLDHTSHRPMDADLLGDTLLRLYEEAEGDRAIRKACLDSWDLLIEQRAGYDMLGKIDQ